MINDIITLRINNESKIKKLESKMHGSKQDRMLDFLIGKDKNKPELTMEEKMLHVTCRMTICFPP